MSDEETKEPNTKIRCPHPGCTKLLNFEQEMDMMEKPIQYYWCEDHNTIETWVVDMAMQNRIYKKSLLAFVSYWIKRKLM